MHRSKKGTHVVTVGFVFFLLFLITQKDPVCRQGKTKACLYIKHPLECGAVGGGSGR